MALRKVIDYSVCAFFLVIEMREQQRHEHNEFFHMFNKELHLKML